MKMVKSLLLGSAAGFVAVAGAQAADLPVKAKAVEYVKVCSLYGEGFYYIPGTDTCIKIGGFLRAETLFNASGSLNPGLGPNVATLVNQYDRASSTLVTRTRQLMTWDVRSQTDYGTLRSYSRIGIQWSTGDSQGAGSGASGYIDRAFIQFAGFTAGKAVSFYDSYVFSLHSYQAPYLGSEGTGGNGTTLLAYTAQLGSGVSFTFSGEDPTARNKSIGNVNGGATFFSFTTNGAISNGAPSSQGGYSVPNFVGNLRIDQAWGNFGVSVAAVDDKASYYGSGGAGTFGGNVGITGNGHPSDKWGWAAQVGGVFNLPNPGDTFGFQFSYGVGATGYVNGGGNGNVIIYSGGSVAVGQETDAVYGCVGKPGNGGGGCTSADPTATLEQTTAWAISTGIEHYWTPALRTSLYGGYLKLTYDSTAQNLICTNLPVPAAGGTPVSGFGVAAANCSPNFGLWQIGSRTIWNPVKNLDVGLEVIYSKIQSGFGGGTISLPLNVSQPAAAYTVSDQNILSGTFRLQRNFVP